MVNMLVEVLAVVDCNKNVLIAFKIVACTPRLDLSHDKKTGGLFAFIHINYMGSHCNVSSCNE